MTVWLHGWGTTPAVWRHLDCVAPGDVVADFAAAASVDALRDVVTQLLLPRPRASIVAWSLGATLAMEHLSQRAHVQPLTVIGATPCFCNLDGNPGWPIRTVDRMIRRLERDYTPVLTDFLDQLPSAPQGALWQEIRGSLLENRGFSKAGAAAGLHYLRDTDLRQAIRTYEGDISWICGQRDTIAPPEAAQLAVRAQDSIQLLDCGHLPQLDCPALLSRLLEHGA